MQDLNALETDLSSEEENEAIEAELLDALQTVLVFATTIDDSVLAACRNIVEHCDGLDSK